MTKEDLISITDYWNWVRSGVFQRNGNRYKIDGTSVYPKSILGDPEKYFTLRDNASTRRITAKKEYGYGRRVQSIRCAT